MARLRAKCARCSRPFECEDTGTGFVTCPHCQATLSTSRRGPAAQKTDPLLGQSLGEFEIVEILGKGGMGAVYKARQASLERFVALKVLRTTDADPSFVSRFAREARSAAAVSHPNIIEIYYVGLQGEYHFIAMEHVDGGNLGTLVRLDGRLPADRAVALMRQTASALAKAHAAGILHRDIKPQNLLLASDGRVKVADFGLAKRAEGDVAATIEGHVVGTALYMAPEVAAGVPHDARSDLYALGATFYYVLAGEPPFQGTTVTQLALLHNQAPVPPLAEKAPDAPASLCRLIHRLLRKAPGERYQSADEVLKALERVDRDLAGAGDEAETSEREAHRAALAERIEAREQRRRKIVLMTALGAGVAALAIVLAAVLSGGRRGDDPSGRGQAVVQPAVGTATPSAKVTPVVPPPKTSTPVAPPPKAPAWADALRQAEQKARAFVQQERFGDAAAEYGAVTDRFRDPGLRADCEARVKTILDQAGAAWRRREQEARQLARDKKFSKARGVARTVLEQFGTEPQERKARDLLAEIDQLEAREREPAPKEPLSKEEAERRAKEEADRRAKELAAQKAEEERSRTLAARYVAALQPVEGLIRDWEYDKATAALAALRFDDERLDERVAARRAELDLLVKLKAKMIDKINTANPPLRKGAIGIPGLNADLTGADERQITASLAPGAVEGHPWKKLTARAARRLAQLVVDRAKADELLASGLLALVYNDPATAEKEFEEARALGAAVDRHVTSIAETSLARVLALVENESYAEAEEALAALEERHGDSPWLVSQKPAVDAARAKIKAHTAEANAEKLYKRAAELYRQKDLPALREVIEQLTEEYSDTKVFTDAERKPTVAEMAEVAAKLGKIVTVSKSGKGNYRTIQAAIDAVEPDTTIVLTEGGFYPDRIVVPEAKKGLTIRGKKGVMPVLGYDPAIKRAYRRLVDIEAADLTLEGLVLMTGSSDSVSSCFIGTKGNQAIRLRYCVLYSTYRYGGQLIDGYGSTVEADHCLFMRGGYLYAALHAKNSICMGRLYVYASSSSSSRPVGRPGEPEPPPAPPVCKLDNCLIARLEVSPACEMQSCTIPFGAELHGAPNTITNSILEQVDSDKGETTVDHCDVFGREPFVDFARPGKRCFSANPLFVSPRSFDYRLQRESPCRKKAADGSDIGCRLTRDMGELLALAFELRRRGLFEFMPPMNRYDY